MAKVYAGIPRKAGAFWQHLREIVYEWRVRLALFRLDVDHVFILFIGAHLAQELLKLPAITVSDTSSTAARRTDALSRTIRKALVMPQYIAPADEWHQGNHARARGWAGKRWLRAGLGNPALSGQGWTCGAAALLQHGTTAKSVQNVNWHAADIGDGFSIVFSPRRNCPIDLA
jgi:hypothetical protein